MKDAVPEARLAKTDLGLVPESEGWFVLNARDATWIRSEERGQDTDFEGRAGVDPSRLPHPDSRRPVSGACTTASAARRTSSSSPASVCS